MVGSEELNRRLGYHPATRDTIPLYEDNRARFVDLACHLDETLPPGRELALALTALQESLMWANAAVACNLAPLEDPANRQPNPLVAEMADRSAAEQSAPADVPRMTAPDELEPQPPGPQFVDPSQLNPGGPRLRLTPRQDSGR
jgi:hypothetical protein